MTDEMLTALGRRVLGVLVKRVVGSPRRGGTDLREREGAEVGKWVSRSPAKRVGDKTPPRDRNAGFR